MFDDFTKYPKDRVRLFFRYLVNSAAKQERVERRFSEMPAIRRYSSFQENSQSPPKEFRLLHAKETESDIEQRMKGIDEERKEELDTKITMFFSRNRFLPFEMRLKKIKESYAKMKSSKEHDKAKLKRMKLKLRKCQLLLKTIKKLEEKRVLESRNLN